MTTCPQSPTGYCQLTAPCEKPCGSNLTLFMCGPSKCEHDYQGREPIEDGERLIGETAVCVKCGARAIDEAAWQ